MISDLNEALYGLPSVRKFMGQLVNALIGRKSILVLLPPQIELDRFQRRLGGELWQASIFYRELSLVNMASSADPGKAHDPLDMLNRFFDPAWPAGVQRTLADFLERVELPEVIILRDLDSLALQDRSAWLEFQSAWAEASHIRSNTGERLTALCIPSQPGTLVGQVPPNELFLEVYWWWGFPSALEIHLLCRGESQVPSWGLADRWREKLLPSLAPGDPAVLEALWEVVGNSPEAVFDALLAFPFQFSWDAQAQTAWQNYQAEPATNLGALYGSPPPRRLYRLWSQGAVYATQEYGVELHPALLARLDRRDAIRHRLWRGQSDLLLPMIDSLRIDICEDLTDKMGPEWPWRWDQPQSKEEMAAVQEDPLAAQWGYLVTLLRWNNRFRSHRHWLPTAETAHYLRNELAHYRPVGLSSMEKLVQEYQRGVASNHRAPRYR